MLSENIIKLNDLGVLLDAKFKELENTEILGIYNTRVFVNTEGKVITIKNKSNNDGFICCIRSVSPSLKKNNDYEYKLYIDGRAHSLHKIVALTFPEICGEYKKGMEVHHKNLNHLDNDSCNLVFLTTKTHKYIHSLLYRSNFDVNLMNKINEYIDFCVLIHMDVSVKGLEDYINEKDE